MNLVRRFKTALKQKSSSKPKFEPDSTTMTSSLANLTPETTNPQSQCPLFSILPGEIRNEIFELALIQFEDDEAAYPKDSYWYRPGFTGPKKSSSALLRTCRLVFLEGQKVFLRELEWAFWFGEFVPSFVHFKTWSLQT
jgi:hypothetical protein